MKKTAAVAWSIYFGAAIICEWLSGDFPMDFFAFPVNIACLLSLAAILWVLWRDKRHSRFTNAMLSLSTTLILLGLLVLSCLIQGLSGWRLTSTWGFVALLCALSAHLLMVTYRGLSHSRPYIVRFALIHIGLLLTLAGIFWGAPDTQEWRTIVRQGQSVQTAVDAKGHGTFLPHSLRLIDLDADYAANGMPEQYEARLLIDDSRPATLRVNHPYPISRIDDIYLSAFNPFGPTAKAHCIVQWVHQPWKYVTWTGIWMLIAGSILLFLQGARKQDARKERRMKP